MRLVLHIGAAKCGSSAIQNVLRDNAEDLRERGVLVPGVDLDVGSEVKGQQIRFFTELARSEYSKEFLRSKLAALREQMARNDLDTVVVSAENLINPLGHAERFAGVDELFDVEVFAYVRRQDDYLISAWQQWKLKTFPSLEEYLASAVGREADWDRLIGAWEAVVGTDHVTVRRFGRQYLTNGDVVDDFFEATGLPAESLLVRPGVRSNRSWSEHVGELAHRVNDLFESPHDNTPYRDLYSVVGSAMFKDYKGSMLLSLDKRLEILEAYAESNESLRARHFLEASAEEPLFENPSSDDVVETTEIERLRGQQDILFRAVLGLVRRVQALEKDQTRG